MIEPPHPPLDPPPPSPGGFTVLEVGESPGPKGLPVAALPPGPGIPGGPAPAGAVLTRYEILEEVGRGGMGIVYRARDLRLGRIVALKALREDLRPGQDAEVRFDREAEILARLSHANVVGILDSGRWQGRMYLVMEWVDGEPLHLLLARRTTDLRPALAILEKAARAVHHAHLQGVVHRDLKPANILVAANGEPKIADFGLARLVGDPVELTRSGAQVGTPLYMSPEQARGESGVIGFPTDVYALGVILYEVLTGRPPHSGQSAGEVLARILRDEPIPPRRLASWVPRDLETIALTAIDKDPKRRYGTSEALADDLRRFLAGEPILARRAGVLRLAWRWVGRHGRLSAAAGALVLSLALFAVWRREEAVRADGAVLEEAAGLRGDLETREARIAALSGPGAPALVHANGELATVPVRDWFEARSQALDVLDRLAALEGRLSTGAGRERLDRPSIDRRRRELALEAAEQATELGQYGLAETWIARAGAAGLTEVERGERLSRVRRAAADRVAEGLGAARAILDRAARWSGAEAEAFDRSSIELVRLRSPELVRLLLDPEFLDSDRPWQRRLAIAVLGKIGDPATKGPEGTDACEALSARLRALDLGADAELAVALARALGQLGDSRGYVAVLERRMTASPGDLFHAATAAAWEGAGRPVLSEADLAAIPDPMRRARLAAWLAAQAGDADRAVALLDESIATGQAAGVLDFLIRAELHLQLGDLDRALADFDRALERDPRSAKARMGRGVIAYERKDPASALAEWNRALEMEPGWAALHHCAGLACEAMGDFEGALDAFDRALARAPSHVACWLEKGSALLRLRRLDEARAAFRRAIELDATSAEARYSQAMERSLAGDKPEALRLYAEVLEWSPRHTSSYYNRGILLQEMGEDARAIAEFDQALDVDPTQVDVLLARAVSRLRSGDGPGALADSDRAIRLQPDLARAYHNRGLVLESLGRSAHALEDYDRALALDPGLVESIVARGKILEARGDLAGALAEYDRATRVDPAFARAHNNRGALLVTTGGDLAEARREFDLAVALDPRLADAWYNRAYLAHQAGDLDAAEGGYTRTLRVDARYLRAVLNRGMVRWTKGDLARAAEDFSRGLEIDPSPASTWRYRAEVRRGAHDLTGARSDLDEAIRRAPADAALRRLLGGVLLEAGEPTAAAAAFDAAIERDPAAAAAWLNRGLSRARTADLAGAASDARRATELAPELWQAWFNLGVWLLERGDPADRAEARAALTRAREAAPPPQARPQIEAMLEGLDSR